MRFRVLYTKKRKDIQCVHARKILQKRQIFWQKIKREHTRVTR